MAALSKLPAELEDRIIDHLHQSYRTLSACALVCRAWLPASHSHFWRELRLTCCAEVLDRFGELLKGSPEVGWYIRTVQLVPHSENVHARLLISLLHEALARLSCLPALSSVALVGLKFRAGGAEPLSSYSLASDPSFATVQALTLRDCTFTDFNDIAAVIRTCHALSDLKIDGVGRGSCNGGGQIGRCPTSTTAMRLGKVELRECFSSNRMIDWLVSSSSSVSSIETLHILYDHASDDRVKDLLVLAGSTLTQLEVDVRNVSQAVGWHVNGLGVPQLTQVAPALPPLDVSSCTRLRALTLKIAPIDDMSTFIDWVSASLSNVNSPVLEEITLLLRHPPALSSADDARSMPSIEFWRAIGEALLRQNNPALKRVFVSGEQIFEDARTKSPRVREVRSPFAAIVGVLRRRGISMIVTD